MEWLQYYMQQQVKEWFGSLYILLTDAVTSKRNQINLITVKLVQH